MADRTYFRVSETSPVREVINAANEIHKQFHDACGAFAAEFGAKKWYTTQSWHVFMLGLVFEGKIPDGWRIKKNKAYATADTKTKAGKEIKKKLDELPHGVSGAWISDELNKKIPNKPEGYSHWGAATVSWSSFELVGKLYILSVPSVCKASPPGCRELKMSEYWKIREKAGPLE